MCHHAHPDKMTAEFILDVDDKKILKSVSESENKYWSSVIIVLL